MVTGAELNTLKVPVKWISDLVQLHIKQKEEKRHELDKLAGRLLVTPNELARCYIEPDCQQYNPADMDENHQDHGFRQPVISFLNNSFFGMSTPLKDGRQVLFVLADAGMGKTSLMAMLKMSSLYGFWPKYFLCEALKIGENTLSDIERIKNISRTVLLLDSLDEDPIAMLGVKKRIKDLLNATQGFFRVIITCRTQFFPQTKDIADTFGRQDRIKIGPFLCRTIYLSMYTDEQVVLYLEKRFPKKSIQKLNVWSKNAKVTKALALANKMNSLRFRPLLLAYIEDIPPETSENPSAIYEALVDAWLLRETRKPGFRLSSKELLFVVAHLAVHLWKDSKKYITTEELLELSYKIPQLDALPEMALEGRSLLNRTSEGAYRFAHYSILEFLVSKHCVAIGEWSRPFPTALMSDFCFHLQANNLTERQKMTILTMKNNIKDSHVIEGIDFDHAPLVGLSFFKANFTNCNFSGANLSGANFKNTKFTNSCIENTNFSGSNFIEADLHSAVVKNCDFRNADLTDCDLRSTDLNGTNFCQAIFKDTKLIGAKMCLVDLKNTDLSNQIISGNNLSGANLSGATLINADLSKANLSGAFLYMTNLMGANLCGAIFNRTTLDDFDGTDDVIKISKLIGVDYLSKAFSGCNFNGADLQQVDFSNTDMKSVDLSGVELSGANFENSNLSGIVLNRASLRNANFKKACLKHSTLDRVDLRGSTFVEADLSDTGLTVAHCSNADFRGAVFIKADLSGSDFRETKLEGADFTYANLDHICIKNVADIYRIKSLRLALVSNVRNSPVGFIEWAEKMGAVTTKPELYFKRFKDILE